MKNHQSLHIPVLLHESIDGLAIKKGDVVIDGTFGGGGHSHEFISRFGTSITLVSVDLDQAAAMRHKKLLGNTPHAHFVQANFKEADRIMRDAGISKVDKVLLDLGTSTFQLLEDTRGFSFQSDTVLHMAFSQSHTGFTAWNIVNERDESSIADIIYAYGQERASRKIAHAIVESRSTAPINTSKQLAAVIEGVLPRRGKTHPATRTFQALRITVNDELATITAALDAWWDKLSVGGRIAVITFHSLEDRIVKQWMKSHERVITKKPIAPSRQELQDNPRSRSAKLRIVEKILI